MPYNNTPVAPAPAATGTANLPLARIKKILAADEDIASCSNNAAFVITVAAEMFIQYLVDQTHTVVKTERKQRRNIQYRDVAAAVARIDNLEFLTDVVPKTTTVRKVKEARKNAAAGKGATLPNGQSTLDGHKAGAANGGGKQDQEPDEDVDVEGDTGMDEDGLDEQEGEGQEDEDGMEVDEEERVQESEEEQEKEVRPTRGKSRKSG